MTYTIVMSECLPAFDHWTGMRLIIVKLDMGFQLKDA